MNHLKRIMTATAILFMSLGPFASPSNAGNDSVALIVVTNHEAPKIISSKISASGRTLTIVLDSEATFRRIARNHRVFYIKSDLYTGWARNLNLVGHYLYGKTSAEHLVVITFAK